MYVLHVIEKIPNAALQDALLVLPFGKVVSLMHYLNIWAQKVNSVLLCSFTTPLMEIGVEYSPRLAHNLLPAQDTSSSDCREPHHAYCTYSIAEASTRSPSEAERHHRVQPGRTAVHATQMRVGSRSPIFRGGARRGEGASQDSRR